MAARIFKTDDLFHKVIKPMKVELTHREVELILTLINDAVSGDFDIGDAPIYTTEELEIVRKLEDALKCEDKLGKSGNTLFEQNTGRKH
jgi:hypothetical protein